MLREMGSYEKPDDPSKLSAYHSSIGTVMALEATIM